MVDMTGIWAPERATSYMLCRE